MPGRPLLVAQITDCHVVERGRRWADHLDTAATLAAVVAELNATRPRPDLVVATGDLVNDGRPEQYEHLADVLGALEIPLVLLPGNHDDRSLLRAHFPSVVAGRADERIDVVVDSGPVCIVGLDTTTPGLDRGCYTAEQMAWLDGVLAADGRPTLIFQHHPPIASGIAWMDENAFEGGELIEPVLARHPRVVGIACGHLHRPITSQLGSAVVTVSPSTGAQLAPRFDGTRYLYNDDPPAFTLHLITPESAVTSDGAAARVTVVSHTVQVGHGAAWTPSWAPPDDGAAPYGAGSPVA